MSFSSSNYLRDCIVKAIVLLETTPCGKPFTEEEIKFFQQLYIWRRPEKFFKNDSQANIVSGTTAMYQPGNQKTLQFTFDNGYIWLASITKLHKSHMRQYRKLAQEYMDECVRKLDEELVELSHVA